MHKTARDSFSASLVVRRFCNQQTVLQVLHKNCASFRHSSPSLQAPLQFSSHLTTSELLYSNLRSQARLSSACRLLQHPIMGYPSSKDVVEIAETLYSAVKSVVILNVKLVVNLMPIPQKNAARITA